MAAKASIENISQDQWILRRTYDKLQTHWALCGGRLQRRLAVGLPWRYNRLSLVSLGTPSHGPILHIFPRVAVHLNTSDWCLGVDGVDFKASSSTSCSFNTRKGNSRGSIARRRGLAALCMMDDRSWSWATARRFRGLLDKLLRLACHQTTGERLGETASSAKTVHGGHTLSCLLPIVYGRGSLSSSRQSRHDRPNRNSLYISSPKSDPDFTGVSQLGFAIIFEARSHPRQHSLPSAILEYQSIGRMAIYS